MTGWLIGERYETAQDIDYHPFKYIRTHHPADRVYYVMRKGAKDTYLLRSVGKLGSWSQAKKDAPVPISRAVRPGANLWSVEKRQGAGSSIKSEPVPDTPRRDCSTVLKLDPNSVSPSAVMDNSGAIHPSAGLPYGLFSKMKLPRHNASSPQL